MSKKNEKGLETTLSDYLLHPKKYSFGLKDLK
jgi:hypothetical protein